MRLNLNRVSQNLVVLAVLLLAGVLALAMVACGGDAATEAPAASSSSQTGSTAPIALSSLEGDISIDGSSTVFPITEAMAEEFGIATEGNVRITVGVSGTGGGFSKFCAGETVISDASRPIKQSEVDLCAEGGVEFVEIPVAIDGLSVMVNPSNDFVECMTVDELHTIWAPEAEEVITRWNQVRPEWPDEKIGLYAPGVDSGTFDYFTETVNGESQASRADFLPSEDDNVLVTGISGDRGALGYFGYAYYAENADRLKLLSIDGGDGCITPTEETINNGTYAPLSRPLFIYVAAEALNQPQGKAFVEYYLDKVNRDLVSETGYIPLPDTVYDLALAKFQNGKTGAAFGGDARLSGYRRGSAHGFPVIQQPLQAGRPGIGLAKPAKPVPPPRGAGHCGRLLVLTTAPGKATLAATVRNGLWRREVSIARLYTGDDGQSHIEEMSADSHRNWHRCSPPPVSSSALLNPGISATGMWPPAVSSLLPWTARSRSVSATAPCTALAPDTPCWPRT